jgi:hypothetical protein
VFNPLVHPEVVLARVSFIHPMYRLRHSHGKLFVIGKRVVRDTSTTPHKDDSQTGTLDLTLEFPEWNPNEHFLFTALTWIKKIFYTKSFSSYRHLPNPIAAAMCVLQRFTMHMNIFRAHA